MFHYLLCLGLSFSVTKGVVGLMWGSPVSLTQFQVRRIQHAVAERQGRHKQG
jgi:hypothetical protein